MGNFRLVVALILVCAVITPLTLSQFVSSQSYTTMTIVQEYTSTAVTSATSYLTSTVITPQNVRYDLTPSSFRNNTGTFLLGYSQMRSRGGFIGDSLCLMYDYFLLNTTTAYEFKIHFESQQGLPIHFLILNADQFNQFNHTNCAYGPFAGELAFAPASDQVWVVPRSGEYVLLFLTRQFVGGPIYLSVQAYGQAIQTSTTAYATNNTLVLLSTQIVTSTLPTLPSITPSTTGNSTLVVAAIIIGLVLVGGAVILRMKRHTKS